MSSPDRFFRADRHRSAAGDPVGPISPRTGRPNSETDTPETDTPETDTDVVSLIELYTEAIDRRLGAIEAAVLSAMTRAEGQHAALSSRVAGANDALRRMDAVLAMQARALDALAGLGTAANESTPRVVPERVPPAARAPVPDPAREGYTARVDPGINPFRVDPAAR